MSDTQYAIFSTSFGWCGIIYGNNGIKKVYLPGIKKEILKNTILTANKDITENITKIEALMNDICKYFDGKKVQLDFPVDLNTITEFQKKVYKKTMQIPIGKVKTYKWITEAVGIPGGARAVGNALSKNPIPLILPCHRVVGCNGNIGGFSGPGGTSQKKKMLQLEG